MGLRRLVVCSRKFFCAVLAGVKCQQCSISLRFLTIAPFLPRWRWRRWALSEILTSGGAQTLVRVNHSFECSSRRNFEFLYLAWPLMLAVPFGCTAGRCENGGAATTPRVTTGNRPSVAMPIAGSEYQQSDLFGTTRIWRVRIAPLSVPRPRRLCYARLPLDENCAISATLEHLVRGLFRAYDWNRKRNQP